MIKETNDIGRGARTVNRIINAARQVFADHGYSGASLNDIVATAEVTTGAIYHHFKDKRGVFRAVVEEIEKEMLEEIAERFDLQQEPWMELEHGLMLALDVCARPDVQRIVFRDAPAILGLDELREIELSYGLSLMSEIVKKLADSGTLDSDDPEVTSRLLLGMLFEASQMVAKAKDTEHVLNVVKTSILTMVRSLKL